MSKRNVILNEMFGRWTVIEDLGTVKDNNTYKTTVLVKCTCGKVRTHFLSILVKGLSKSCGCWRKENASVLIKSRPVKHGLSKHPLFLIWRGMKARCYNKLDKAYKDYGARGVYVCEEWINDFLSFYNWAINNGWEKGKINDRINNDEGYSPKNCRFVTASVSTRNTRRNNNIEFMGETKCITDWAADLNISPNSLKKRIKNWPIEIAMTKLKVSR